jgi:RNA polymerase sigma-70 factor (ECF subfamily)
MYTEKLLSDFKEGDQQAFRYYYNLFYDSICLFGYRILKDEECAKDIAQEVFVNLWQARHTLQSVLHLKMFLYRSMRHRCINYIKMKKLEQKFQNNHPLLETEESFYETVIEEEIFRFIREKINQLPDEQRKVILMHLEGKNNIEIATLLQISVNTVKTHKARARHYLRIQLKDLLYSFLFLG